MLDIMKSEFYKVCKSKVTFVTALCLLGISAIEIGAFLYGKLAGGFWGKRFLIQRVLKFMQVLRQGVSI